MNAPTDERHKRLPRLPFEGDATGSVGPISGPGLRCPAFAVWVSDSRGRPVADRDAPSDFANAAGGKRQRVWAPIFSPNPALVPTKLLVPNVVPTPQTGEPR